ncbi:MAG: Zn-dependent alcohol dehydrogenase [Dinoroseobacter sp.]|nr:Zn-dependent alcohol dehydrogenase [Dinoroseobacter sp.]
MSEIQIRAAVCTEFAAPLEIETLTLAAPGLGEVQVKLAACAVCHSDITFADGGWGGDLPAVYGHEAAGHISAVGDGVSSYAVGDPVMVSLIRACGTCPSCSTGRPVLCTTPNPGGPLSRADGTPVAAAMNCGAFADHVTVDASQIVKLPEDIPLDVASLLSCGVITGIGAVVNTAKVRAGETVVVIGAGGVGLNAIQGARIAGAARIVAVDMQPSKLDDALEFGATDGIVATDDKPWKALRKIAPAGADVVLVTVGAIPAYQTAPKYLAFGGRLVAVGMPHTGHTAQWAPDVVAYMGTQYTGSKMGDVVISRDIPWMVDLYKQGRLQLDNLISGRWSLDQINEAIADTKSGKARRNVILFD